MTKKKRQHYVPVFYLRAFSDVIPDRRNPMVWVADVESRKVVLASPYDVANEKFFYDWRDAESWAPVGTEPASLEDALAGLENCAAPVVRLFSRPDLKNLSFSDKNRYDLSNFIGLQLMRTPVAIELAKHAEQRAFQDFVQRLADHPSFEERWNRQVAKNSTDGDMMSAEIARSRIKQNPPTIQSSRDRTLAISIFAAFDTVARFVFQMPWTLLVAPEGRQFFTSDHPVYMHHDEQGEHTREVSIALSPRVRLVVHDEQRHGQGNIVYLTGTGLDACNRVVLQAVGRFFYCASRASAEWTIEHYADDDTQSILRTLGSGHAG